MQGCVKRPSTVGWIMVEFCKPQKFIFRFWNDTNVQFVYWKCLSNFWLNREILGIRGDLRRYICHICVKTYGYVCRKKGHFIDNSKGSFLLAFAVFLIGHLIVLNIETSEKFSFHFMIWLYVEWILEFTKLNEKVYKKTRIIHNMTDQSAVYFTATIRILNLSIWPSSFLISISIIPRC